MWGGEVSDWCQCDVSQGGDIHAGKESEPRDITNSGLTPVQSQTHDTALSLSFPDCKPARVQHPQWEGWNNPLRQQTLRDLAAMLGPEQRTVRTRPAHPWLLGGGAGSGFSVSQRSG